MRYRKRIARPARSGKMLFAAKPGSHVKMTPDGQLMANFRLTGWKKPFTAEAMTGQ